MLQVFGIASSPSEEDVGVVLTQSLGTTLKGLKKQGWRVLGRP